MLRYAEVNAGMQGLPEGSLAPLRMTATGALVLNTAHCEFYEASSRGNILYACTAAAGVALGTTIATTAAFYLHNPIGSDMFMSVLAVGIGYISGTLGAGSTYLTSHVGKMVANPSGTAIAPRPTRTDGQWQGRGLAFTTATVATQYAIRPLCSFGPMLATTAFQPFVCKEQINGEIVLAPGYGVGVHSVATAGTTDRVRIGMTWEEIPIDFETVKLVGESSYAR